MVRWEEWWCASCIIVRPSNALHRGRLYIGNSKWSIRYQIAWEGFIKIWQLASVGGLSAERNTLFTSWRWKICERDCVRIIGVFSPIQGCSMPSSKPFGDATSCLSKHTKFHILSFKAHLSTQNAMSALQTFEIFALVIFCLWHEEMLHLSKPIWEHKTQCQRCQVLKYLLLQRFFFDMNSAQRKIKASMEGTALI